MTKRNPQPISPILKTTTASALIIGSLILGLIAVGYMLSGASYWEFSSQNLPNIMPILMAIIGFFAVGYSVMCVLTSKFFQSIAYKRPNYSHLEF